MHRRAIVHARTRSPGRVHRAGRRRARTPEVVDEVDDHAARGPARAIGMRAERPDDEHPCERRADDHEDERHPRGGGAPSRRARPPHPRGVTRPRGPPPPTGRERVRRRDGRNPRPPAAEALDPNEPAASSTTYATMTTPSTTRTRDEWTITASSRAKSAPTSPARVQVTTTSCHPVRGMANNWGVPLPAASPAGGEAPVWRYATTRAPHTLAERIGDEHHHRENDHDEEVSPLVTPRVGTADCRVADDGRAHVQGCRGSRDHAIPTKMAATTALDTKRHAVEGLAVRACRRRHRM